MTGRSRSCTGAGARSSLSTTPSRSLLKTAGAYSHLITDHYHYWEDGGATYHTRYNSYEFFRGQESDPWKVLLDAPMEEIQAKYHPSQNDLGSRQNPCNYMINREFITEEADFPSVQCFDAAFRFLDAQPQRRQLAAPGRDLRPARALLRPRPPQGEVPHRLRRPDPRLAALRARAPSRRTRSTSCAPTTSRSSPTATSSSAACSTISTRTTSGRTPR